MACLRVIARGGRWQHTRSLPGAISLKRATGANRGRKCGHDTIALVPGPSERAMAAPCRAELPCVATGPCHDKGDTVSKNATPVAGDPAGREDRVSRKRLIELLNEDLAREYQAIIAYVVYSQVIKGAQYMSIATDLETHAGEELRHAIIIAKQIDYLGGAPTVVA